MSGTNIVADTNTLIYLHEGNSIIQPYLDSLWFISTITEIELLGSINLSKKEETALRLLLNDCYSVELNTEIKNVAIQLKQKIKIKLPDAIIAATSLWLGFPLITADKDFINIPNLELIVLNL